MIKRFFCVLFFIFFVSVSGCATVEGTAKGVVTDTKNISHSIWTGMQDLDAWIKENLW